MRVDEAGQERRAGEVPRAVRLLALASPIAVIVSSSIVTVRCSDAVPVAGSYRRASQRTSVTRRPRPAGPARPQLFQRALEGPTRGLGRERREGMRRDRLVERDLARLDPRRGVGKRLERGGLLVGECPAGVVAVPGDHDASVLLDPNRERPAVSAQSSG